MLPLPFWLLKPRSSRKALCISLSDKRRANVLIRAELASLDFVRISTLLAPWVKAKESKQTENVITFVMSIMLDYLFELKMFVDAGLDAACLSVMRL